MGNSDTWHWNNWLIIWENVGEFLHNQRLGRAFVIRAQNSVAVKEKMDEVGLITSVGKMPISKVKITKN